MSYWSIREYYPIRLLDKYLFSEFFKTFLGTLIMLTGILLISQVMDGQKVFIASKEKSYHIYLYLLFSIPRMIVMVTPPALMFAVCFVVGQFSANKELVSSMAAGVSFYRTVTPILFFGLLLSFVLLLTNELIVRPCNSLAASEFSMIQKGVGTKKDMVYQFHIKGKEGFYYVYWYDAPNQAVKGGFNYIKINSLNFPELVISAKNAKYIASEKKWILDSVEEIELNDKLLVKAHKNYAEKIYYFPESADYFSKPVKKLEEMNFFDLTEEIQIRREKGIPFADLEVERHAIFAVPLLCFIVVLIGAIAGGKTSKLAGVTSLGVTIVVTFGYYIIYSVFRSIGENGTINAGVSVWSTSILFLSVSYVLFKRMNL
jgi:lipopolysaccharide export system permease protein